MSKPIIFSTTPNALQRESLSESIAAWEDGQRAETGRGSFEWWYFDAHLDDGSTAVIVFSSKPLLERNGPLKPNMLLTITRPDGSKTAQYLLFPREQFSAAKARVEPGRNESCDIRIGSNWTRGDLHRYDVHCELNDLAVDLTFTGLVPPWRPGAGKIHFGDLEHYFAWLPSIPFGKVAGTLTYDGQTRSVSGTGYHDHNWGNVGLNEVMDHWYWGRAHLGEYTLIFVEQIAAQTYGYTRMPVFMLAKGDQILIGDSQPLMMQARDFIRHSGGRSYPREVDFNWESGNESVRLRLRQPKLIEGTSLLLLIPKWQQWLARLFANPYYFRFNAELDLKIDLEKIKAQERGSALYEIMVLQGKKHP